MIDGLLDALREYNALRDGDSGSDVLLRSTLPAIAPTYASGDILDQLCVLVRSALQTNDITSLYVHQFEAVALVLREINVVLQAPTASGKALAFQLPMLSPSYRPGTGTTR